MDKEKNLGIYELQKDYFEAAYRAGEHGWPIHDPSPAVVRFIKRFQSEQARGRVLDIGCGEGRHAAAFASAGYLSIGLDYQALALARATAFTQKDHPSLHFVLGDVFDLPFPEKAFDVLIDYGCLHHVRKRDTERYLQSVVSLLKPGGYFLLSCFSMAFKHHPGEKRRRDWLVHKGHYDRFFRQESFQEIFWKNFDILQVEEEKEDLYAFYHVLMVKNGAGLEENTRGRGPALAPLV